MSRPLHVEIQESVEELREIMNAQTRAKFRERLQILYWIKTEFFNSLQELADHLGRSKSVVVKWLKLYRTQGTDRAFAVELPRWSSFQNL